MGKFYIISVKGDSVSAYVVRQKVYQILFSWNVFPILRNRFPGAPIIEYWGDFAKAKIDDLPHSINNTWLFFGNPEQEDLMLWEIAGFDHEIITIDDPRLRDLIPGKQVRFWWCVSDFLKSFFSTFSRIRTIRWS